MAKHTEHVHVMMDAETRKMLEMLAKKRESSAAEVIRQLIRRSAKALREAE